MASITTGTNGIRRLQFSDETGIRRTVSLGKMPKKAAESVKGYVERILQSKISRCSLDNDASQWIAGLEGTLRDRLANVGLVEARSTMSLEGYVKWYIRGRNDAKPNTIISWRRTLRYLLMVFDSSRTLQSFRKSDCKDFRQHMIGLGYAEATVRRTCGVARQFFEDAKERGLIGENPFKTRDVPVSSVTNQNRQVYIPRETANAVLAACPNLEWQLLFALSRYAGLRCPSEHLSLKWDDVHWDRSRMTVRSPKTEHHEGGAMRVIPIFPELRPYLEAAFEARGESEYVIARYRDTNANLRTRLLKIINRAGVKPWPKLFHNLRASCETDLAKSHPIKAVCDWIGNSIAVAQKHYLQTTESDFDRAADASTQNATLPPPAKGCQPLPVISSDKEKCRIPSLLPSHRVGVTGIETNAVSNWDVSRLGEIAKSDDAEYYATSLDISSAEWMTLPENARESIIRLFRERDELLSRFASMRQQAGSAREDISLS